MSVKVSVAPVVGLREWEFTNSPIIGGIETWQIFIIWIQCVKEVNHLGVICCMFEPVVLMAVNVAWWMPYLDIVLIDEHMKKYDSNSEVTQECKTD